MAQGDFGRQLAEAVLSYPAFVLWSTGKARGRTNDEVSNGTTFFLDCGQGPFGVTAGHVYEGYEERANRAPCQIGLPSSGKPGVTIDLRERLIAHSQSPDIATYRISPEEIDRIGAHVVMGPPKEPKEDDIVAFVGFPKSGREIVAEGRIAFAPFHGAAFVESASLETIACPIPREWITPIQGMRFPEASEDTAGMSGGPVFSFDRGAVMSWRLLGVISDGGGGKHEGDGGPFLDVVVGARADLINADGTINELPHPRRRTSR
jgi:hypothetical protein